MYKTILVAVDGSDHAHRALNAACDLAGACKADLHIIHVPQLELLAVAVGASAVVVPHSQAEVEKAGKAVLDQVGEQAARHGAAPASMHLAQGDPALVIHDRAKALNADLLVTGRRGLGKLSALLLGSVSQKLSQIAPCAHLTVP